MVKKTIIVFMLLSAVVCFASYDNSNRTVMTGGFGVPTGTPDGAAISINDQPVTDFFNTIQFAGTVQTVTARWVTASAPITITTAKMALLRKTSNKGVDPSVFDVVGDIVDISGDLGDAVDGMGSGVRFNLTFTTPFSTTAAVGDRIGFYVLTSAGTLNIAGIDNGQNGQGVLLDRYYDGGAAGAKWITGGADITFQDTGGGGANRIRVADIMWCEVTMLTNDAKLVENTAVDPVELDALPDIGTITGGEIIPIPFFSGDIGQYITIESVKVATDNTSLAINFRGMTDSDGTQAVLGTITLDFTNAAEVITLSNGANSKTLTAGEQTDSFDIHIWYNPTDNLLEVLFCNITSGQGGEGGDKDIRFLSITDAVPESITINRGIRSLDFVDSAGGAATVSKVITHRQPVLAVGDSYLGTKDSAGAAADLTRIGTALESAFSESRYVIRGGGIAGGHGLLTIVSTSLTSLASRWDTVGSEDRLVAFRDVIVVPVIGINDIAQINSDDNILNAIPSGIAGVIAKIASDALMGTGIKGGINDVVIVGQVIIPSYTAMEQLGQKDLNAMLETIAYRMDVPFVDNSNYSDGFSSNHLDSAGNTTVAGRIADAFENNRVPQAQTEGRRGRYSGITFIPFAR